MFRTLAFFLAAITLSSAQPDTTLMEKWIAGQRDLRSMEIEFRQERQLKGLRRPVVSEGRIWLDRAERMRWQVGDPPRQIAIYRDKEVFVIQPAKKIVQHRRIGDQSNRQTEAETAFLETGMPRSMDDFGKFFLILETSDDGPLQRVRMRPRDGRAATAVAHIDLLLDRERTVLAGYDVSFRDGSEIRTRFTRILNNPPLDEALFKVEIEGFKVEAIDPEP